jgi:DNA-binding FrmR family transcriptional regulator
MSTTKTEHAYHYQSDTDALLVRLRRMEGQVRGVQ